VDRQAKAEEASIQEKEQQHGQEHVKRERRIKMRFPDTRWVCLVRLQPRWQEPAVGRWGPLVLSVAHSDGIELRCPGQACELVGLFARISRPTSSGRVRKARATGQPLPYPDRGPLKGQALRSPSVRPVARLQPCHKAVVEATETSSSPCTAPSGRTPGPKYAQKLGKAGDG
jgi:hypothetical protein